MYKVKLVNEMVFGNTYAPSRPVKYLKNFLESLESADYYQLISQYEYIMMMKNTKSDKEDIISKRINNGEKISMKDIVLSFSPYSEVEVGEIRRACQKIGLDFPTGVLFSNQILLSLDGCIKLKIYKVADEWYLVNDVFGGKFYKCDQLDGLIHFLFNPPE